MSRCFETGGVQLAQGDVQARRISSPLNSQAPGPLFVVGIWRSGTSLLYTLLNQHPQIALMYEGELPLMQHLFPGGRARPDWLSRWDFLNNAPQRHNIQASDITLEYSNLRAASEGVCKSFALRKQATIWGCKSPAYYDVLPRLARDFPEARFLIIWRDPFDICRSIQRAANRSRYFARKGMLLRALLGCHLLKQGCDHLLAHNIPVHQLHYENLIREPEAELRRICEFVDIPFDPCMLSLQDADRSAIYADEHHALVNGATIVASREPAEVLQPRFRTKISRYMRFWRRKYGPAWPAFSKLEDGARAAGLVERAIDQILLRAYRLRDDLVLLVYARLPLKLLQKYRDNRRSSWLKVQRQEQSIPPLPGSSSDLRAFAHGSSKEKL